MKPTANGQRRAIVSRHAERFEAGNPFAWVDLLMYAVDVDPDIPGPTKVKLRARLFAAINGHGAVDPVSPRWRRQRLEDSRLYADLMNAGGSIISATKIVADKHGISISTVRRAYKRHIKREPNCVRLGVRRRLKKR